VREKAPWQARRIFSLTCRLDESVSTRQQAIDTTKRLKIYGKHSAELNSNITSGALPATVQTATGPPHLFARFGQFAAAMFRIGLRVFDSHFAAWLFLRFLPLPFASGQCFVMRFT
jgi:hypothetical protein